METSFTSDQKKGQTGKEGVKTIGKDKQHRARKMKQEVRRGESREKKGGVQK